MESAGALFGSVNTGRLGSTECHCPAFGDCIRHPLSQEEPSAALASPGCQGCWCDTPSSGSIKSWLLLCLPMCLPARLCCASLDSPLSWDGRKLSVRTWELHGASPQNRWAWQNGSRATEAAPKRGESPTDPCSLRDCLRVEAGAAGIGVRFPDQLGLLGHSCGLPLGEGRALLLMELSLLWLVSLWAVASAQGGR